MFTRFLLVNLILRLQSYHLFHLLLTSGTKKAAHRLKILFGLAGLKAAELHGDMTQTQRLEVDHTLQPH